jgi:hypothetical protein
VIAPKLLAEADHSQMVFDQRPTGRRVFKTQERPDRG